MKKKNIAWGLFFIFLAAVYLVISSTGMELGVGLPGIFMTVLFVWLFVEGIKDVNFYSIVFAIAFICILYRKPLGLEKLGLTSWTILGAALLLSIGLSMIFKDVRRKNWKTKTGFFLKSLVRTTLFEPDWNGCSVAIPFIGNA